MTRRLFPALCIFALAATCALAHETWLLPSAFTGEPDSPVSFDLTSGMGFPVPDHAITADRVQIARARCGSSEGDLSAGSGTEHVLRMRYAFPVAGVGTVWLSLAPRDIDLKDDEVEEYFAEIGATDKVRETWSALRGKEPWHETYVKHAKTFVAVGKTARDDRSWASPVGLAMELIPITSPLELKVGGEAQFDLRMDGAPIPGVPVGLMTEGSDARSFATTDMAGRVSFRLARTGRTLVFATHLRRIPDKPGWRSDFSTLTLAVGP